MRKTFFASDIHISHRNILHFSPSRIDALGMDVDKDELASAYKNLKYQTVGGNQRKVSLDFIDKTIKMMDEKIVDRWNETIGFSDDVYLLGDFSFAREIEYTKYMAGRLNGRIHLIKGNHDNHAVCNLDRWEWVRDYYELRANNEFIVMCHYQMMEFNKQHRGGWAVHGHQHGAGDKHPGKVLDCGMEQLGKIAIEFEELKEYMATRPIVSHGNSDENM